MSENFHENLDYFPEISKKNDLYAVGEAVSWNKIPDILFRLPREIGASPTETIVALYLARETARTRAFPTFTIKRSDMVQDTGLSDRAISKALEFLAVNRVLSVHYRNGFVNRYTWNEEFLKLGASGSVVPVNDVQGYHCTTFRGTTERGASLYIEFSLEIFISSFKDFFSSPEPYRFYVPAKRGRKKDSPHNGGSTISVSRVDAWRDAAYHCYEQIKHYDDALPRIYLALMASRNLSDITFPKKVLVYRSTDHESMNEARSKSHIREYLHTNEDFIEYVNSKTGGKIQ